MGDKKQERIDGKEKYEEACMKIVIFETEDIITASGGVTGKDGVIELPFIPAGR